MNHNGPIIDSPVAPDSADKELARQMIAAPHAPNSTLPALTP